MNVVRVRKPIVLLFLQQKLIGIVHRKAKGMLAQEKDVASMFIVMLCVTFRVGGGHGEEGYSVVTLFVYSKCNVLSWYTREEFDKGFLVDWHEHWGKRCVVRSSPLWGKREEKEEEEEEFAHWLYFSQASVSG